MPGAEASSAPMTSAKARPIQSEAPGVRFSKRRTASRWIAGGLDREQETRSSRIAGAARTRRRLENTLFLGQELLEFGGLAQSGEVGFLFQLLLLLEALLEALAEVLQREVV